MKDLKTILVADDDPAILDSLEFMLTESGYKVEGTSDSRVVKRLAQKKPALLLLDIWMSGESGENICRILKSEDATKNIPIIMISANRDTEEIAKKAGADDFVEKPFDMNNLLNKIERLVR
jgi:DNA-binding response OmpR family regulator